MHTSFLRGLFRGGQGGSLELERTIMDAIQDIHFTPTATIPTSPDGDDAFPPRDLGLLSDFDGEWVGDGFNVIWRPFSKGGSDHFLALNLTKESISFVQMDGVIPNRGLLQADIPMSGLHYFQKIDDAIHGKTMHMEPGIWATVPATTNPPIPASIVRMASIPHGTVMLAQGQGIDMGATKPAFGNADIRPFPIGQPLNPDENGTAKLTTGTPFRTPPDQLSDIDQNLIDNPNLLLERLTRGLSVTRNVVVTVSSIDGAPVAGGGVRNTGFVGNAQPANAQVSSVTAVFWILSGTDAAGNPFKAIAYTQTVFLDFATRSWPHVSVGVLRPKGDLPPALGLDPSAQTPSSVPQPSSGATTVSGSGGLAPTVGGASSSQGTISDTVTGGGQTGAGVTVAGGGQVDPSVTGGGGAAPGTSTPVDPTPVAPPPPPDPWKP